MASPEPWDPDSAPQIDAAEIARLRRYMLGEGMVARIRRCAGARRDAARMAAAEELLDWCRRVEAVGLPGDPAPEPELIALLGPVVDEVARAEGSDGDDDDLDGLTLERVLGLRRRSSPEAVVALRLADHRAVAAGSRDAEDITFLLPEPLSRRLTRIDAEVLGSSSVALSWALRVSLVVKAVQRLDQCQAILAASPASAEHDGDRARIIAAIRPIASALVATERMRPDVAPHLVYLMLASIIDTWIGHELAADREESSDEGLDRVRMEQALAEREGTLRWLDRVIDRLARGDDQAVGEGAA